MGASRVHHLYTTLAGPVRITQLLYPFLPEVITIEFQCCWLGSLEFEQSIVDYIRYNPRVCLKHLRLLVVERTPG